MRPTNFFTLWGRRVCVVKWSFPMTAATFGSFGLGVCLLYGCGNRQFLRCGSSSFFCRKTNVLINPNQFVPDETLVSHGDPPRFFGPTVE